MAVTFLETTGGESIEVGDSRTLRIKFYNRSGKLFDPSGITAVVQDPDNGETTYTYSGLTISKVTTGIYDLDITFDKAGDWFGKVYASGVDIKQFKVTVDEVVV